MSDKDQLDEDMIAPMDGGNGSPGTSFQTPDSMGGSMDDYSLLGPGKSKKKSKKKKKPHPNNRIMTFKDFMARSTKQ
jgi:hypothetical protein